jgi:hypothetical protein
MDRALISFNDSRSRNESPAVGSVAAVGNGHLSSNSTAMPSREQRRTPFTFWLCIRVKSQAWRLVPNCQRCCFAIARTRVSWTLGMVLGLSACTDPYDPDQRAFGGALFGAGTGAAIGGIAGGGRGAATSALIGGRLGAVGGAATTPAPGYYQRSYYGSGYNGSRYYGSGYYGPGYGSSYDGSGYNGPGYYGYGNWRFRCDASLCGSDP